MPKGARDIDNVSESPMKDVHNLSIEKLAIMYISMRETIINLQNEIHVYKERQLNFWYTMKIQNIEIESLKHELNANVKSRIRKRDVNEGKCWNEI